MVNNNCGFASCLCSCCAFKRRLWLVRLHTNNSSLVEPIRKLICSQQVLDLATIPAKLAVLTNSVHLLGIFSCAWTCHNSKLLPPSLATMFPHMPQTCRLRDTVHIKTIVKINYYTICGVYGSYDYVIQAPVQFVFECQGHADSLHQSWCSRAEFNC